jgi:hypothetical protein
MYPPPTGEDLTPEQARELDDTFLASNPFEYFRSRTASLLSWAECALRHADSDEPTPEKDQSPASPIRAEFNAYLGQPVADVPFKELDVDAQVAADALALRRSFASHVLGSPPIPTTKRRDSGLRSPTDPSGSARSSPAFRRARTNPTPPTGSYVSSSPQTSASTLGSIPTSQRA